MKNKIGWCHSTFNPVWGCRNHCEYCYARKIAKRFGNIRFREEWKYRTEHNMEYADVYFKLKKSLDLVNFKPSFLYSQFNKKLPKKPQRIFVGSMSEIYYWEKEWIERVIEKVKQYPQHTFQFLTKHMEVYADWVWPENCILGVTITKEEDFEKQRGSYYFYKGKNFISFEPLLSHISIGKYLNHKKVDWVIIGAETGNRKGKVRAKLDWVLEIVRYCENLNIPVYIKDDLVRCYWQCIGYKEFPKKGGLIV